LRNRLGIKVVIVQKTALTELRLEEYVGRAGTIMGLFRYKLEKPLLIAK